NAAWLAPEPDAMAGPICRCVPTVHSRISPAAVARIRPSGLNVTEKGQNAGSPGLLGSTKGLVAVTGEPICVCAARFQSRAFPSPPAVARILPPGLKATLVANA